MAGGATRRAAPPDGRGLRGGGLPLGGLEDPGAVLVGALVGAGLARPVVVALGQDGAHLVGRQLVVPGPRLVALERVDAIEDGRAALVPALVGGDLGELDLRQVGETPDDLLGGQGVVARDGEVLLGRHGALGAALGVRHAGDLAGLAGGPLGLRPRRADGIRRSGVGHAIARLPADVGPDDGLGELRDLAQHALEHALLVAADRRRQPCRLVIGDRAGQPLERRVGGDLEGLGGARVLGVLEDLLLAARSAQQVERGLAERYGLADDALDEADGGCQWIAAAAEVLQPRVDAARVVARLVEMALEAVPVAAARGHGDLRLQDAHQRELRREGLVEVLHDFLSRRGHAGSDLIGGLGPAWARPSTAPEGAPRAGVPRRARGPIGRSRLGRWPAIRAGARTTGG